MRMRARYLLLLFAFFSLLEMIAFHLNVISTIPHHSLNLLDTTSKKNNDNNNNNNNRVTRRSIHTLPKISLLSSLSLPLIPPPPTPLEDAPLELLQWLEGLDANRKSEKEIQDYQHAIQENKKKNVKTEKLWLSDEKKYKCERESDLSCYSLPSLPFDLPGAFLGACAPAFTIIGTAKSGTTSLYYYLVDHPQVNQALSGNFNKEVRYFTDNWHMGIGWYLQQFPPITPYDIVIPTDRDLHVHMINGEASPTYFYDKDAPARMKAVIPNAKLIVILRNPIERAYSEKMQLLSNRIAYIEDPYNDMKYQIDTFNKCFYSSLKENFTDPSDLYFHCYNIIDLSPVKIRSSPYVLNSIYVHQVRNWLKYFPRNQLLFIKSEDMFENAARVMDRVTEYLGLCKYDWGDKVKTVYNKREKIPMSVSVRKLLTEFYNEFTLQLYDELDIDFGWDDT